MGHHKKEDNGLVLFVFRDDRKVRVEVGYRLEGTITDAISSRVIREEIVPRFREGRYAEGIDAGVEALARRIEGGAEAPRRDTSRPAEPREHPLVAIAFLGLTCLIVLAPLILVGLVVYAIIRQISREHRQGGGPLTKLASRMSSSSRTYSSSSSSSRSSFSSSRSSSSSSFSSGGGSFGGGGASGSW
ncbi:MAG TPA: TPM domain-containing protein [Thermoanaerobaculia bacterium]|nr:TPM domain-containing protein [Thermoanaerobaculia bacterium]